MPPTPQPAPRIFSTAALDASIARQRTALPPTKTVRVAASATDQGARLEAIVRVSPHTFVGGYAEKLWGGPGFTYGAQAVWVR